MHLIFNSSKCFFYKIPEFDKRTSRETTHAQKQLACKQTGNPGKNIRQVLHMPILQ